MDTTDIDEILCSGPSDDGTITAYDGRTIAYRIQLLPPGRLSELKIERQAYLADRGITECTPATAEIYDEELRIRICAEAVRNPETDAPLAPLETWRKTIGSAVDCCIQHYMKLEALEAPTDMELAAALPELETYVKKTAGSGARRSGGLSITKRF